jgi:hypothetical protein
MPGPPGRCLEGSLHGGVTPGAARETTKSINFGNKEKNMGDRVFQLPAGVKPSSAWPYEEMPKAKRSKVRRGGWVLAISIDSDLNGAVTYYPHEEGPQVLHIDNGTWSGKKIRPYAFYRVATKEEAEKFTVFCAMGYGPRSPELLPHQDGTFWGFNWSSLTKATVKIASQVADHFFNDRYEEAWAVGRAFGDQIRAAENAAYDKARRAAA